MVLLLLLLLFLLLKMGHENRSVNRDSAYMTPILKAFESLYVLLL
jgi:hypothetical protein